MVGTREELTYSEENKQFNFQRYQESEGYVDGVKRTVEHLVENNKLNRVQLDNLLANYKLSKVNLEANIKKIEDLLKSIELK